MNRHRYCITKADGASCEGDPDRCCGGLCLALTDAVDWLIIQFQGADVLDVREHVETLILNLAAGDFIEVPDGRRLWRER
jgi:hypothetical protein